MIETIVTHLDATSAPPEATRGPPYPPEWRRLPHTILSEASNLDKDDLVELAREHRSKGQWPKATRIWQQIAVQDHAEALERLAKY